MIDRGHVVTAALPNLERNHAFFEGLDLKLVPLPTISSLTAPPFPMTQGYAHILANIGFTDRNYLLAVAKQRHLQLQSLGPDLVIVDHSPVALLALRGGGIPYANLGTGFFCPPAGFPMPIWDTNPQVQKMLIQLEIRLLMAANQVLTTLGRPVLRQLSDLFDLVPATILATYGELDHFGKRPAAIYWGHWGLRSDHPARWPEGNGPKIYAYLKPSAGVDQLLQILSRSQYPTLLVDGGLDRRLVARHATGTIRFEPKPVNLADAASQAAIAIINANHATAAEFLRAGKPMLLCPLFAEQFLLARRVVALGAARMELNLHSVTAEILTEILVNHSAYASAAKRFADIYEKQNMQHHLVQVADLLESLIK
jgi:hypothetical protein